MPKRYQSNSPFYFEYSEYFIQEKMKSEVLNIGLTNLPNIHQRFWDERQIVGELLRLTGNENQCYFRNGIACDSLILLANRELASINERFRKYQVSRVEKGYEKPKEFPPELLTEKLKVEAKIDVLKDEVSYLQNKLDEIQSVVKKEEDNHVLEYGLLGVGKLHGTHAEQSRLMNVLKTIDGQTVGFNLDDDGEITDLFIDDSRSIYDGMLVSDYRKLSKQFIANRLFKDKQKFFQMQEIAKKNGDIVPDQPLFTSRKKVNIKDLPEWPDWAKNVKDKQASSSDSSSSMRRTK